MAIGERLLRGIAGGSNQLLDSPHVTDATRGYYANMGRVIILVVALTAAAAGFAWGSVFHSVAVGVVTAVGWFFLAMGIQWAICFCVDNLYGRSIVAKLALVLGVLVMAGVLASVNSSFILMQTMDQEIEAHIERKYRAQRDVLEAKLHTLGVNRDKNVADRRTEAAQQTAAVQAALARHLEPFQQKVDELNTAYQKLMGEYSAEVAGKVGSGKLGEGPAAKAKKLQADETNRLLVDAQAAFQTAELKIAPTVRARLEAISTNLGVDLKRIGDDYAAQAKLVNRDIAELDATPRNGFIDRHAALTAVFWESPFGVGMWVAFFFMLETLIILLKLISPTSEYQVMLAARMAERKALANEILLEAARRKRTADAELLDAQVNAHHARASAIAQATMADEERVRQVAATDATPSSVAQFAEELAKRRRRIGR